MKTVLGLLIVLSLAAPASGQTKITGTSRCAKPDQQQMIEIGERPGHAFAISKVTCNWTKPMEIAAQGGALTPSGAISQGSTAPRPPEAVSPTSATRPSGDPSSPRPALLGDMGESEPAHRTLSPIDNGRGDS